MSLRVTLPLLAAVLVGGAVAYSVKGADERMEKTEAPAGKATDVESKAPSASESEQSAEAPAPKEEKQEAAKADDAAPKAAPGKKSREEVLKTHDIQITYGKHDAPVTIVEYFSLSCPHCAQFFKESQPKLIKDYVDTGKVLYEKRYFPHNAPGMAATMLMQCVEEDKRQQFLQALFNMQNKWAFTNDFKKDLKSIAQIGGMGPTDFDVCLADKTIEESILTQRQEALDALEIEGIPVLFVDGVKLEGSSYARLVEAVEKSLKK